jgi:hypothetical protein
MNYFPNRDDAYRIMPRTIGQPVLRGIVPDLPDIGWREPPSAAVFGGISLVHEAAAISTSTAYPSPAPIAAAITARAARVPARAITNRLRRAYAARSDAFAGVNKERQAAFTSQNYCDNKIAPVARYRPDPDGFCFAGRSKPAPAEHS